MVGFLNGKTLIAKGSPTRPFPLKFFLFKSKLLGLTTVDMVSLAHSGKVMGADSLLLL